MPDPIETLMDEHRVIEKVLDALEAAADREMPFTFYERAAEFFASFADGCHHAKEEVQLFPVLERKGIPREGGPIGVMCHEHVLGRDHVTRLRECARRGDREGLRRVAREYALLLRGHIFKEDNVLFAIARDVLDAKDMGRLREGFEATAESPQCRLRYRELADELLAEATG